MISCYCGIVNGGERRRYVEGETLYLHHNSDMVSYRLVQCGAVW